MKHFSNKLFLTGLIISLLLIIGVYFFNHSRTGNTVINHASKEDTKTRFQINRNGTSKNGIDHADPWDVWVEKQTDQAVKKLVDVAAKNNITLTEEELDDLRDQMRSISINAASTEKLKSDSPPPLSEGDVTVEITENPTNDIVGKEYTGAQSVEALMNAFHIGYNKTKIHSEIDRAYPPEDWIRLLLDKGLTIQNASEYSGYMDIRWDLVDIENDAKFREMRSRSLGIPASDIEELKASHLKKEIDFKQRLYNAKRTDARIHFIAFDGSNNSELPLYIGRKMTYVRRISDTAVSYIGTSLTQKQKFDLSFRGIEPEGIEIIYIDEMGKPLEEKPPPFDREKFRKMYEETGFMPPTEDYETLSGPRGKDESNNDEILESAKPDPRELLAREAERRVEEAAHVEFEKFRQKVRQLEKFATMSDTEIAAELEKQLRQQFLPELPTEESIENALFEIITSKPLTTKRFEEAMRTLERNGPKEGLRRLAQDDPELAEYFRRNPQKMSQ